MCGCSGAPDLGPCHNAFVMILCFAQPHRFPLGERESNQRFGGSSRSFVATPWHISLGATPIAPLFVRAGGTQQVSDTSYRPTMTPLRVFMVLWRSEAGPTLSPTVLDFAPHLGVKIAWLGSFARFCPPQRPILHPTGHSVGSQSGASLLPQD